MARPTTPEPREKQINVKLTAREFGWVQKRAEASRARPTEYARMQVLADRPLRSATTSPASHLAPLLIAHLSRVGNNLNQIARKLNQFGPPAPPELHEVLLEVRRAIREVVSRGS